MPLLGSRRRAGRWRRLGAYWQRVPRLAKESRVRRRQRPLALGLGGLWLGCLLTERGVDDADTGVRPVPGSLKITFPSSLNQVRSTPVVGFYSVCRQFSESVWSADLVYALLH